MSDKPVVREAADQARRRRVVVGPVAVRRCSDPCPTGRGRQRRRGPAADARVAVLVGDDAATVRAALDRAADALLAVPVVWVTYPKGNRTDINRDSLWPILAERGLRPITQVSLDDTWSALRFRPLRPDEPPFTGGA